MKSHCPIPDLEPLGKNNQQPHLQNRFLNPCIIWKTRGFWINLTNHQHFPPNCSITHRCHPFRLKIDIGN